MKTYKLTPCILTGMLLLLMMLSACEYEGPVSTWDMLQDREQIYPEITQVLPEDAGAASTLIIVGSHFSPVPENDWVYFDQVRCEIISASETAIEIYRPDVVGDSITVSVSVINAATVAKFGPYRLEAVVEGFGNFAGEDNILAMTVDADERLYLAMGTSDMIRLNSDGSRDADFLGTTEYTLWTDMEMGSDGNVYMARSNNVIFRLSPEGGAAEEFGRLESRNDRIKTIDFDQNDNLFGGGNKSGLVVIHMDSTFDNRGYYNDWEIISVRVYDGYVYVAAKYKGNDAGVPPLAVYRHPIIDTNGGVGNREMVLDWTAGPYGLDADLGETEIFDMAISESGVLYIGSDHPDSPLVMYDMETGEYSTLFFGIIPSPVSQIVWGNGNSLYVIINRATDFSDGGALLKINTGEPGATYYGR